MDSDIPNKSPGSNIDKEETDQLLFEDWEEPIEPPEAYHSDWSDLYSYAEEQHSNYELSQPSTSSPRNELPAIARPQSFVGNQNVDYLEQISRDFHQQEQHQSFQASAPSAPSPPSDLSAAMPDAPSGNQNVDLLELLNRHFHLQGEHQSFQASAPPDPSPPSDLSKAMSTDALKRNQDADWQELVSRCFHQQGQHKNYQASAPLAPSLPSGLPEAMSTDALRGNQKADWLEQVSQCFHQQGQHRSFQASAPPVSSPPSDLPAATLTDVLGENWIPDHEYDGWVEKLSEAFQQQGQHQNFQVSATPAPAPPSHLPAASLTDALGENERSDDWHVMLQDQLAPCFPAVQPNQSSQTSTPSTQSDLPTIMVTDPLGENQPPVEPSVANIHLRNQPVQEQLQHQNLMRTQTFRYLQHSPLPATMPDQTFPQNQSHGCQPAESNPELTVTFDELDELLKKYRVKKDQEDLKQDKVTSLLSDRLGERIPDSWVSEFHNFDTFFKNLCRLRAVLQLWMANYEEIQSTTNLSRNEILDMQIEASSHPTVRYLDDIVFRPAAEQIAVRNSNRPGSSTSEVTAHRESSVVSDMERNVVHPANQSYEGKLPCDKYVKTPTRNQRVPTSSASKNCGGDGNLFSYFNANRPASLRSPRQVNPSNQFNDEMLPHGKSFKTPPKNRAVPTSPASKNCYRGGYLMVYFDATRPASLRSPRQKLFREENVRPEDMMPLQEIADFVEYFRKWRTKRGISQGQIHGTLMKICDRKHKGNIIWQLESLSKFLQFACKLKPVLENWLNDIDVPESEPE